MAGASRHQQVTGKKVRKTDNNASEPFVIPGSSSGLTLRSIISTLMDPRLKGEDDGGEVECFYSDLAADFARLRFWEPVIVLGKA